jgi:hypothetical protein
MNEAKWLKCSDPQQQLKFLWRNGSHRKLRLFACACSRRVWHLLTGENGRVAVEVAERRAEVAERYAVGMEVDEELASATDLLEVVAPTGRPYPNAPAYYATWQHAPDAATSTAQATVEAIQYAAGDPDVEQTAQAATLRDIFANPFRPVVLNPAWGTPTVAALATAAYEERILPAGTLEPDRLAVLADALEDAGCDNADLLSHLRTPGPHVRGCWVLDLILSKDR